MPDLAPREPVTQGGIETSVGQPLDRRARVPDTPPIHQREGLRAIPCDLAPARSVGSRGHPRAPLAVRWVGPLDAADSPCGGQTGWRDLCPSRTRDHDGLGHPGDLPVRRGHVFDLRGRCGSGRAAVPAAWSRSSLARRRGAGPAARPHARLPGRHRSGTASDLSGGVQAARPVRPRRGRLDQEKKL
jgi:hypothetical protein